jgi:hypothetical protein
VIWCAVNGPSAISFVLITPSASTQEIEPYFKAVIQSVNVLGEPEFKAFESLRCRGAAIGKISGRGTVQGASQI